MIVPIQSLTAQSLTAMSTHSRAGRVCGVGASTTPRPRRQWHATPLRRRQGGLEWDERGEESEGIAKDMVTLLCWIDFVLCGFHVQCRTFEYISYQIIFRTIEMNRTFRKINQHVIFPIVNCKQDRCQCKVMSMLILLEQQ